MITYLCDCGHPRDTYVDIIYVDGHHVTGCRQCRCRAIFSTIESEPTLVQWREEE